MQFEMDRLPSGIKRVSLQGRLDMQGTNEIDNKFAFAVATERAPVIVDLAGVDFIASIGIRMLVTNAKALKSRGGKVVLCNPQPLVGETLTTAGIDLLIPVYADFDAACASLLSAA